MSAARCWLLCPAPGGRQWQRKPERAAYPRQALDAQVPTMPLDDRLADVEAQPQPNAGATELLDAGRAREPLEEVALLLGRKPRPAVTHLNAHAATLPP